MSEADDGFLARWSKRKSGVQGGLAEPTAKPAQSVEVAATAVPPAGAAAAHPIPIAETPQASVADAVPLPTMEDVALLTRGSDYSPFVRPGVDPGVSNAAMKKLFSDPHFNVMDGLDTYIDDYGKPDPIPLSMLRQMNQAKFLGLFDDEEKNAAAPAASTDGTAVPVVAQSLALEEPAPPARETRLDDNPDLRLQQDDDVERPGAAPGLGA
jgi:hypothetical protein